MMYNKIVQDYFFHPLHVGILDVSLPYNVHCGQAQPNQNTLIDLFWMCDSQGIIKRSCFKAVGSPYLIAALEWLCRRIEGQNLWSLPPIDYQLLVQELGIPKLKYPIAVQVQALYNDMILLMKKQFAR